jgi:hypothetical protein
MQRASLPVLARAGIALAIAGSAIVPSARAEFRTCHITGRSGTTPVYTCSAPVGCDEPSTCPEALGDAPMCLELLDSESICIARCSTLFGCTTTSDCPRIFDGSPTCVPFSAAVSGDPPGLCLLLDPGLDVTYCADGEVIPHYFSACHTDRTGSLATNYWDGDCDGDGCPNGIDPTTCTRGGECGTVSRGLFCATMMAADGGVATVDAGAATDDAGPEPRDAGATMAGDASGNAGDGGRRDAGPITQLDGSAAEDGGRPGLFDAGTELVQLPTFSGGGGCRCAAPGSGRAGSGAAGALSVLALLLLSVASRRRKPSRAIADRTLADPARATVS